MIVGQKQTYFIRERLGQKQSLTPEGFLLCENTPIYRTGQMLYGPGEVYTEIDGEVQPLETGLDGISYVDRSAEDVFRPETLASFEGKPVVNSHPDDDVTPDNWRRLASGVVLRVRRGEAAQDDVAIADLLITNKDDIEAVRDGLREVSCGYQAKYEKTGPARYRQFNIIGNHVALVENGRCGPRCAIGDKKTINTEDCAMSWIDKVKAAFAGKDEAALNAALAEAPKGDTVALTTEQLRTISSMTRDAEHKEDCDCAKCKDAKMKDRALDARMKKVEDAVDTIGKDVKSMKDEFEKKKKEEEEEEEKTKDNTAIEGSLEMEAPPGTGDEAKKAKDSAYFVDSWQETVSLAEIITPGYQAPTFDAKAAPRKTLDAVCQFRRGVLELAHTQPELKSYMDGVLSSRDMKRMTCDEVRTVFRSVGGYKRMLNNTRSNSTEDRNTASGGGSGAVGKIKTPADMNKRLAEMYK
jgi:hypothetical protein